MEGLFAGILTSIAILIVLWKIGFRRFKYIEVPMDIAVTLGLMFLFWGTFSGMMTAIFGGLFFSILFRLAVRL
jgi:hypothetical protein